MNELKQLWSHVLGDLPSDQQFDLWAALHSVDIVRQGILKTAQKNLSTGGTMSTDHKIRFASKCMLTATALKKAHEENRAKLAREFGGDQ